MQQRPQKTRLIALVSLLVLALLAGCAGGGGGSTPDPAPGNGDGATAPPPPEGPTGSIVIGSAADVTNLNPLKGTDSYSYYVLNLIYDPLFQVGPDLKPVGQLVELTETPDDTTYIFHLRKGVTFHDGQPLTAEDVKYTYDYILNPDNGYANRALYSPIESIEVIDEHTVKFTTSQPYAPLTTFLTVGIVPKHIDEADPDALSNHPIGTGPYEFVSWQPQDRLVLKANENWWVEGEPKIRDVTFMPMTEATTRLAALETGTIDIADNVPAAQVSSLQSKGLGVFNSDPNGYYFFAFNQSRPPFDNKLVREAFTLAINRDEIVDFVWYGLNETANSPIISTSWAYEPNVTKHPYDPERAKQLLAEAGYPDGVTVQLLMQADDITRRYVEPMQQQWAEAGIKLELVQKEWGAFFQDVLAADFELLAMTWLGQDDPDRGVYRQFHSSMHAPNGHNWIFYTNPRVDELLDEGRATLDQQRRAEIYREVQRHVTEDFAYLYLADYRKALAYGPNVHDFVYSPYSYFRPLTKAYVSE